MNDKYGTGECHKFTFWVVYDATGDRQFVKMDSDTGCLAMFDNEESAASFASDLFGVGYREVVLYSCPQPAVQVEPVEDALHARAMGLYMPPFRYDSFGGYIWDSENNMVADNHDLQDDAVLRIRGWGRISYMDDPEALQDKMGELVSAALTAYWMQPADRQPDVTQLVEALEDCITWLEPYDDIKPRDWKTDRENLRRAHQSARAALAAHRKGGEP